MAPNEFFVSKRPLFGRGSFVPICALMWGDNRS
jgi:hypothetical protein